MSQVSGNTPGGEAYLDLRRRARQAGRPTDELIRLYVLEAFLSRLSAVEAKDKFVLKGGVLLAAFGDRRATRDVDLAGLDLSNEAGAVLETVRELLVVPPPSSDGVEFEPESATVETIREQDEYPGFRVSVDARLASARARFHVDVNVGDPIWPRPATVLVPRIRGGEPIQVAGYPLHMVHAEKIVTAVQRGTVSTRWRDFADIWVLSGHHAVDGADLQKALVEVARHRDVRMVSLVDALDGYADIAQDRWAAWRRRNGFDYLPEHFGSVLAADIEFAAPAVAGKVAGLEWNPNTRRWLKPGA